MTLSEGIVKINSKLLEASELKRYDKLEKEAVGANAAVLKGKHFLFKNRRLTTDLVGLRED